MNNLARACLIALGSAMVVGLVGCSDPLSNGYGGWYWQMPEVSSSAVPAVATNNGSTTTSHAKVGTSVSNTAKG